MMQHSLFRRDRLLKNISLLLLMILPLGAALFYRPVWTLSGSLFFFLVGTYLILISEIAKRRNLV
jgi:hypothetical protein